MKILALGLGFLLANLLPDWISRTEVDDFGGINGVLGLISRGFPGRAFLSEGFFLCYKVFGKTSMLGGSDFE